MRSMATLEIARKIGMLLISRKRKSVHCSIIIWIGSARRRTAGSTISRSRPSSTSPCSKSTHQSTQSMLKIAITNIAVQPKTNKTITATKTAKNLQNRRITAYPTQRIRWPANLTKKLRPPLLHDLQPGVHPCFHGNEGEEIQAVGESGPAEEDFGEVLGSA